MTTAAQGMQFFKFLQSQDAAAVGASRDLRDFEFKKGQESRALQRFQFDIDKDKLDRENAVADKNSNDWWTLIKDATGAERDHLVELEQRSYNAYSPYQKQRLDARRQASPAGDMQRKLWAFDKANPPEKRPGIRYINKIVETKGEDGSSRFETESVPVGQEADMYQLGDWALRQERTKRSRLEIQTGQKNTLPIRLPMPNGVILTETPSGSAEFLNEEDLQLSALAAKYDVTPGKIRADGYKVFGEEYSMWIGGQKQTHRTVTDIISGGVSNIKMPAREGQAMGTTSDVNPFGHLPQASQSYITEFQSKFMVGMQDTDDLKMANGDKDRSVAANMVRDVRRRLDSGESLESVSKHISGLQPGINYAILDPKEFDKFTWYNPLDVLDPRHIYSRIKGAMDGGIPEGIMKDAGGYGLHGWPPWNLLKGSYYSQSENMHIKSWPGAAELFEVPGQDPREYHVSEPESGVSQVYSKNFGILLGTREQVQNALSKGILDIKLDEISE